jgi:hypothetical protein
MKLSCLPVSFFSDIIEGRMTLGEWARIGASLGLDAVDFSIPSSCPTAPQRRWPPSGGRSKRR